MSDTKSTTTTEAPLVTYFAAYASISSFTYEPTLSAHDNFARLSKVSRWTKKSTEWSHAQEGFKDALVQEFNFIYGTNGNDLSAWQNLCGAIGIEPIPDTIKECQKVSAKCSRTLLRFAEIKTDMELVSDAHINIVDLIETVNTGRKVKTFATLDELAAYTKKTDRFFPKENTYQGGLLKELLKEIINPYLGRRRNGSEKRKRRRARRRGEAAAGVAG